jgi:hypothetical protein
VYSALRLWGDFGCFASVATSPTSDGFHLTSAHSLPCCDSVESIDSIFVFVCMGAFLVGPSCLGQLLAEPVLLGEFATVIEEELLTSSDIPQCHELDPVLAVDESNFCSAVEAIPFADSMIDKPGFVA